MAMWPRGKIGREGKGSEGKGSGFIINLFSPQNRIIFW